MIEENNIPKHWQIKKLGEVCDEIFAGGDVPKNNFSLTYSEEYQIPIYANGEKNKGLYGYTNLIKVNSPSVTISARGTIGYAEVRNKPFFPIVRLIVLKPNKGLDVLFIKYVIDSCNIKHTGSSIPQLTVPTVKSLLIPLPPLSEQKAIVFKIEELLSDLENGKQQLRIAQQQLKIYRQSLLKWAFEGKLTENWRKENKVKKTAFETLQEVSAKRKKIYTEKKKLKEKRIEINYDFIFSKSELIDSWAIATLDKLIYIAGRIGWRGLTKDEYTKEGPLFLSVHSLNYGKYVDFKDAYHISEGRFLESPEIILQNNDILLCKDGAGIGKIGIIKTLPQEGTVNSSLLIIRGLEIFTPEYLFYLLSGPKLQRIVQSRISGSATPHLFQNDIRKFELLVPPIEEQKLIVDELESKLTVCDKIEETISQSLLQAESLRQSILKQAFEGKLL